ncbi:MAG: hypothetical protein MHM6MM_001523 [Cercozoa sp. M6MM]
MGSVVDVIRSTLRDWALRGMPPNVKRSLLLGVVVVVAIYFFVSGKDRRRRPQRPGSEPTSPAVEQAESSESKSMQTLRDVFLSGRIKRSIVLTYDALMHTINSDTLNLMKQLCKLHRVVVIRRLPLVPAGSTDVKKQTSSDLEETRQHIADLGFTKDEISPHRILVSRSTIGFSAAVRQLQPELFLTDDTVSSDRDVVESVCPHVRRVVAMQASAVSVDTASAVEGKAARKCSTLSDVFDLANW